MNLNPLRFIMSALALGATPEIDPTERRFNVRVKSPKTPAQRRRRAKGLAGRRHRKLVRRMERARS